MTAERSIGDHGRRYLLVGAVATAAHYALLTAGVEWWGWPPALGAGLGAALGAQVAFVGNRHFTFGHRGPVWAAWWRFQATALLGMATSVAVVALGTRLGLRQQVVQAVATGLGLVITFLVNRRWTFG